MAEEAFICIWDVQNAGNGWSNFIGSANMYKPKSGKAELIELKAQQELKKQKLGAAEEGQLGMQAYETAGSSLDKVGITGVGICKVAEVLAGSAEEATKIVREYFGNVATTTRVVVKPNTNMKAISEL